jgi:hypothetical protein
LQRRGESVPAACWLLTFCQPPRELTRNKGEAMSTDDLVAKALAQQAAFEGSQDAKAADERAAQARAARYITTWNAVTADARRVSQDGSESDAEPLIALARLLAERQELWALDEVIEFYAPSLARDPAIGSRNEQIRLAKIRAAMLFLSALKLAAADEPDRTNISTLLRQCCNIYPLMGAAAELVIDMQDEIGWRVSNGPTATQETPSTARQVSRRRSGDEINATLLNFLFRHHDFDLDNRRVENKQPAVQAEIARSTGLPPATICTRFKAWFDLYGGYEAACDNGRLALALSKAAGDLPTFTQSG